MNSKNQTAKIIAIFASILIVLATYFFLSAPEADKKKYNENKTQPITDIGGELSLINLEGLEENTSTHKGKYRLIYFGFTFCPDICPHSLNIMSETINITDKYNIPLAPIFITVDPERDTVDILKPYLAHFNTRIIGYTGSNEQIESAAKKFKVYYAKVKRENEKDYLMDHTSFFYLLDKDGQFIKLFPSSVTAEEMANEISIENRKEKLSK